MARVTGGRGMKCPKCGGDTNTYRHPFAKIWCISCGFVLREEGEREDSNKIIEKWDIRLNRTRRG